MPWKETCQMDERIKFIADWSESGEDFAKLCRVYGISRKTGYKWVERYEVCGPSGLEDRPPLARTHPNHFGDDVVSKLIEARKDHPHWGPRKIRSWIGEREPGLKFPAASTIGDVLKKYGLIRPRKRRLRVPFNPHPLSSESAPNDVWCADFKGHFALRDRTRCHPLTVTDHCTRYLLKCEGLESAAAAPVRTHFERAFREFGLPLKIRTDNGSPFAGTGPGGLTRLSAWWIRLGIEPERIEPGHPEQNGRHERMHRTLKAETASPPKATLAEQQLAFDLFRAEYNEERPHEALDQKPPARSYALSMREYTDRERPPEYGEDFKVRIVSTRASIGWMSEYLPVSPILIGEPVGLRQTGEEEWELKYGPVLLGKVRIRDKKPVLEPQR